MKGTKLKGVILPGVDSGLGFRVVHTGSWGRRPGYKAWTLKRKPYTSCKLWAGFREAEHDRKAMRSPGRSCRNPKPQTLLGSRV